MPIWLVRGYLSSTDDVTTDSRNCDKVGHRLTLTDTNAYLASKGIPV